MEMNDPALAHPKEGKASAALDRKESLKVQARSGGRCEVYVEARWGDVWRCDRRAIEVHHMISGRGKRNVGISVLAEHKLNVCQECHLAITGDIGGRKLLRIGGIVPVWTDRYRRAA